MTPKHWHEARLMNREQIIEALHIATENMKLVSVEHSENLESWIEALSLRGDVLLVLDEKAKNG